MAPLITTIKVEDMGSQALKSKPSDNALGFGIQFTDRMFIQEYKNKAWNSGKIGPLCNLNLHPATLVFHYGQAIFEGMKAYKHPDNTIALFRPKMNAQRFTKSAERMMMPPIPEGSFVESISKLVTMERDWIPRKKGTSLYIRPTMIASETVIGLRASKEYIFFVILSPSAPFFKDEFAPIKLLVHSTQVRAVAGGVGAAKVAGNYGATLYASDHALQAGYSQVLWLDGKERKYVEEAGSMNVAFVIDDTIYTPPLSGTILDGVTRNSVITLAKDLGIPVVEKRLSITEIFEAGKSGNLKEVFSMGTAAIIAPIGELKYKDEILTINDFKNGKISTELYENIIGIQYGTLDDRFNWMMKL